MTVTESIDPVTGRPVLTIPQFGPRDRDDESRMGAPIAQVGGITVEELAAEQDRSQAVRQLSDLGIRLPKSVDDATAVLDALRAVPTSVPVPRLGDADPDRAVTILADYTDSRAREVVAADAKAMLVSQASARLETELADSLDVAVSGLGERFSKDAAILSGEAELIASYANIAEVAEADPSGKLVGRFTAAREAAKRLNGYADIVLRLTRRSGVAFRSADSAARLGTLVADFEDAGKILEFAHANNRILSGRIAADLPFGPYPTLLASGAMLSMPLSGAEWASRIETYNSLVEAEAMRIFMPDFSNAA